MWDNGSFYIRRQKPETTKQNAILLASFFS